MVDRPKLGQMLADLIRYRQVLGALAASPRGTFLSDADRIGNSKYHLVVAIECCIDVANHLIASEGFRIPTSSADSLAVLAEQGILPADEAERFRNMARFCNRLVHLYWEVDDEAVYAYLQDCLLDFDVFAAEVGRWMRRRP